MYREIMIHTTIRVMYLTDFLQHVSKLWPHMSYVACTMTKIHMSCDISNAALINSTLCYTLTGKARRTSAQVGVAS